MSSQQQLEYENYVISFASQIIEKRLRNRVEEDKTFTHPSLAKDYLKMQLSELKSEVFSVLFLDNCHRFIAFERLFQGTIDGATVYPREVVKAALHHNAAAVILSHNHPSGNTNPSASDKTLTTRLTDALALVDVRVLDHIIVGDGLYSFAENGELR